MTLDTATKIRLILGPLIATAIAFPDVYQPALDKTWYGMTSWRVYNWSSFETIWTVFWYALIEVSMTVVFMNHPERRFAMHSGTDKNTEDKTENSGSTTTRQDSLDSPDGQAQPKPTSTSTSTATRGTRVKGMRRPSRRIGEIITYILPLLAMDLVMIKKFADVPLDRILESGGYTLPSTSTAANLTTTTPAIPKTFLIPTIHNITLRSPFQLVRALPTHPPTSRRLLTELLLSLFIYDATFFLFHWSLHNLAPLRRTHTAHHAHPPALNPQVTNQLSVPERLGLVMLANFSLNVIGAHVLTRTVFVVLFVWLLVELHCGMDVGWGYEKVLPRGWGHGARGHWRHHVFGGGSGGGQSGRADVAGGYAPFFRWWDGVWGLWAGRGERGVVEAL